MMTGFRIAGRNSLPGDSYRVPGTPMFVIRYPGTGVLQQHSAINGTAAGKQGAGPGNLETGECMVVTLKYQVL
eukprot:3681862-Rhodomonas_salina.3